MDKNFFEKVFSEKRLEKYFKRYGGDTEKAITHYRCNIELSEAFYPCISTFEVVFRNGISRELSVLFGREDWYVAFAATPGLTDLNKYISQANKQIAGRKELSTPSKMIAELTLGFWVSLFNVEYERILWKDLRRVFHHEPISWNLGTIRQIHTEMLTVMGWMNKDIPLWIASFDRFDTVFQMAEKKLNR
jgi:hypothetical protein